MKPLLFVLLLVGCSPTPAPPPLPPEREDQCDVAGRLLTERGCRQAQTPGGTPFAEFCRRRIEDSIDIRPDCIAGLLQTSDGCDRVSEVASVQWGKPCPPR